jgi:N utilization substance protein A
MLGKAIVLVREDQLSLAIGRRGQNVRLASKLCGWDIEIMTRDELESNIEQAVLGFSRLDGCEESLAEKLVGEGFLTYDELSIIEPDDLMEMGELTAEQADQLISQAESMAQEAEVAAALERRRQREQERIDAAVQAEAAANEPIAEEELAVEGEPADDGSTEGESAESVSDGQPVDESSADQVGEELDEERG